MPLRGIYKQEPPAKRWVRQAFPYALALILSIITTGATLWLPGIAAKPFFVLFLFATGLCAWVYGLASSWLSAALNTLAVTYFVLPPQRYFSGKNSDDLVRVAIFSVLSFVLAWLIARLRATEEALKLAGERFQLAHEVAKMWAWELDVESGTVVWSTDSSRGQRVHRDTVQVWFANIYPEDREQVTQAIRAAAEFARPYAVEFRIMTNGDARWLASSGEFYKTLDGRQRMIGVNIDVSARKLAEQTLEAAAKAEMASQLAHEINNPLQALTHALYLLHQQVV